MKFTALPSGSKMWATRWPHDMSFGALDPAAERFHLVEQRLDVADVEAQQHAPGRAHLDVPVDHQAELGVVDLQADEERRLAVGDAVLLDRAEQLRVEVQQPVQVGRDDDRVNNSALRVPNKIITSSA
nr:hypothetical protein [Saccharopolyspora pogona]